MAPTYKSKSVALTECPQRRGVCTKVYTTTRYRLPGRPTILVIIPLRSGAPRPPEGWVSVFIVLAIARHQIARLQQRDIARHNRVQGQTHRLAVAQQVNLPDQALLEFFDRLRGGIFLRETEQAAADDDYQNDCRIDPLSQEQRQGRPDDQD